MGTLCLDLLENTCSSALMVKTALLSIQALLSASKPDDIQDAKQVAEMYVHDQDQFLNSVRVRIESYNMHKDTADGTALCRLIDTGSPWVRMRRLCGEK